MKLSTPLLACLPVLVLGALAASAQAQTSLLAQTFDGYTAGGTVPFGATQTFLTTNPGIPVSNTNAATLFPNASTGSAVAGGDAGTNYATFGGGASYVARTTTIAGLGGTAFSVYYDVNVPAGAAGGAVILNLITAAAADTNGGTGTFSGFTLSNTGAVGTNGTGVTLTGGTSTTVPLGTQIVLSLVVNDTAAAVPYLSQGFNTSLPAFTSDLYAATTSGITYLGRLTSATGTNATTNTPQQLGFRTFGGNTTSARFNELDIVTGAAIAAAVPEPATSAWMIGAASVGVVVYLRRRLA